MKRPPRRTPDDWRGYIAFVMAMGIAIGFGASLIMSASARTPPINETTATLLSTLGGAMIGAVATYLGMGRNNAGDDDEPKEHDHERDDRTNDRDP